ncbi:hypothetical protein [Chryseobacterium indoltheticum]|uniref:hypothetical protein n=1 Tax=Chryseobacterium indoltheticum TaxID=254 RepID=UPI003F49A0DE
MKKIFTVCTILSGLLFFAQEAGKAGELLKNEASKREIESTTSKRQDSRNSNSDNSSGFRNSNNQNNTNRRSAKTNYQWNNNYGYAEVFLRIPEQGNFSVELADQLISNNSGKYRFFDLPSGRIPISIYENGYLMYRTTFECQK